MPVAPFNPFRDRSRHAGTILTSVASAPPVAEQLIYVFFVVRSHPFHR